MTGGGHRCPPARGLRESGRPVVEDLRLGLPVGERHRVEPDAAPRQGDGRDPHESPTGVAGVDDAASLDLDPGVEAVREPEATCRAQLLELSGGRDLVGWRIVVVGDAEVEDLAGQPADRFGRDPRHRQDRRLDSHPSLSELTTLWSGPAVRSSASRPADAATIVAYSAMPYTSTDALRPFTCKVTGPS